MKNLVCFLLLTLCFGTVFAQSDSTSSKFNLGIAANTSFSYSIGHIYSPLVTFSNDRHQLELGPKLNFQYTGYYTNRLGVEFNYKFFPNKDKQKFSPFLLLNAGFFNRTIERDYIQVYGTPSSEYNVSQKATRRFYDLHLGYGIQYRFLPKCYISTNIGIGLNVEDYDDNRVSSNTALSSYKGYLSEGLSLRAALTIGYTF